MYTAFIFAVKPYMFHSENISFGRNYFSYHIWHMSEIKRY